jgi:hypothetical protein
MKTKKTTHCPTFGITRAIRLNAANEWSNVRLGDMGCVEGAGRHDQAGEHTDPRNLNCNLEPWIEEDIVALRIAVKYSRLAR